MPLKRHHEFARPGVFEGMNVERRGICASRSFMDQAHRSSFASAGSRNDVAPIMLPRPKEPKVFDLRTIQLRPSPIIDFILMIHVCFLLASMVLCIFLIRDQRDFGSRSFVSMMWCLYFHVSLLCDQMREVEIGIVLPMMERNRLIWFIKMFCSVQ